MDGPVGGLASGAADALLDAVVDDDSLNRTAPLPVRSSRLLSDRLKKTVLQAFIPKALMGRFSARTAAEPS
jgi:hypothetical protein